MNAHAFRHFYDYHFAQNRKILGVETTYQDYIFYAYEHAMPASEGDMHEET